MRELHFGVTIPAVLPALLFAGCATRPAEVADPQAITLRAAVFDVADTLNETRLRTRNRPKVGLFPEEATVVFNVSAKSTDTTGLKLDTSLPASVGWPLALSSSYQLSNEGNRGNQITIKFKNILTAKITNPPPGGIEVCFKQDPPPSGCPVIMKGLTPQLKEQLRKHFQNAPAQ